MQMKHVVLLTALLLLGSMGPVSATGSGFDDTGLQFEYKMEEGTGSVVYDSSGNGRHLEGTGIFSWKTDGPSGGYLDSTTTSTTEGFIFYGDDSSSFLNGYHTLEGRFRFNAIPDYSAAYVVQKQTCTVGGTYIIYSGYYKRFIFDYYNIDEWRWHSLYSEPLELVPGEWYHIVATHDSSGGYMYLNGKRIGSNADGTPFKEYGANTVKLGDDQCDAPSYFPGALDEIRGYSRPMSAEEVKYRYDGTPSPPPFPGDKNKGHGNDPDGIDEDNPGQGCAHKNANGNSKRCVE